jgi:hypothetical protein
VIIIWKLAHPSTILENIEASQDRRYLLALKIFTLYFKIDIQISIKIFIALVYTRLISFKSKICPNVMPPENKLAALPLYKEFLYRGIP